MSLQLILGGSGAGKSTYLYSSIIEESINNPDTDYIIIVPEQYTMATQKRVVELHPRKGSEGRGSGIILPTSAS